MEQLSCSQIKREIGFTLLLPLCFVCLSCKEIDLLPSPQEDYGYKEIFAFLTSEELGGRYSGSDGASKTVDYISQYLDGKTEVVEVSNSEVDMKNVLFTSYGYSDSLVVIGAHYDAYGFQKKIALPGADDNISGVSVLLKVAYCFIKEEPFHNYTYVFCFWDGEEIGRLGSKKYVSALPDKRRVKLYINVDTCGSINAYELGVQCDGQHPALHDLMLPLSLQIGAKLSDYSPQYFTTDCEPFEARSIPFVNIGCLTIPKYLHKAEDTIDNVSFSQLHKIQLALYDFLISY